MPLRRAWTRHRAGLPLVMLSAKGPGRIAFSHDRAGEAMALPVEAGASIDVSEGHMVVASESIDYDWNESNVWYATNPQSADWADSGAGLGLLNLGLEATRRAGMDDRHDRDRRERRDNDDRYDETTGWHYPVGRYIDRFTAGDRPGLVMIGAGGAAFLRDLAEGESLLVKPPSLLIKDPSVTMQLHVEYPAAGVKLWRTWGNRYLWLRLWGPGRIGIESAYLADADPGTDFRDMSHANRHARELAAALECGSETSAEARSVIPTASGTGATTVVEPSSLSPPKTLTTQRAPAEILAVLVTVKATCSAAGDCWLAGTGSTDTTCDD